MIMVSSTRNRRKVMSLGRWSRTLTMLLLLLAATVYVLTVAPAAALAVEEEEKADYYVAPNGNDRWSGTLPAANAAGTDGPLATL
jgi:hypothetical protein